MRCCARSSRSRPRSPTSARLGSASDYVPLLRLPPSFLGGSSNSGKAAETRRRRDRYMNALLDDLKERVARGTDIPCITGNIIKDPEAKLTDLELSSICLSMVSAGLDTLANTFIWSVGYLAQHPEFQERAYAAIRDVYHGDIPDSTREDVEYITALHKECSRFFSVLKLSLPRATLGESEYRGVRIPDGTTVFLNAWAIHHDAERYGDFDVFRPERFLEASEASQQAHYSFGAGRRMCAGVHLANRELSVVVSGTDFHRPSGQILASPGDTQPVFSPCKRLDYELEMGFVSGCLLRSQPQALLIKHYIQIYGGKATQLGQRLSPQQAQEHIFGVVLLNDWSARDIQTWEYVPLGPFLSKNFCTTISPWVVSMDALEPFGVGQYAHEPALLPYLEHDGGVNYDVDLTVEIKADDDDEYHVVSRSSMKHMYYTLGQMLAHHSTTGCSMRPGDLLGTGTLSAPRPDGLGSLLEKSKLGREPFGLGSRKDMTFLKDGDCVRLTGSARGKGYTIGFGHCEGTVLPALPLLVSRCAAS
ncbi:hypothetical protein L7F22_017060 [Adiantum nelumboides]|nr:hypothetical protein [Adiantum nelumboides]